MAVAYAGQRMTTIVGALDFGALMFSICSCTAHDSKRANGEAVVFIHYTALPFVRLENGGLVPGESVECPHLSAVIRRADAMFHNEANA
jgi:hypothetical protein